MTADDLPAVAPLLSQLGYDLEKDEVERRFRTVADAPGHAAWVAVADGGVVGFLHLFGCPALEKPPEAVVQAMAVEKGLRGRGIGRALMARAEQWAVGQGFRSVALSSQAGRSDAHAFYARLGFETAATSLLLRKDIEEPGKG